MKFRYSIDLHCSQVIIITNHECSLLTIHNNNKTFQESWLSIKITTKRKSSWIPTHRCDILSPSGKPMFPERLFTFIKVGVSNILQLQCNTTIMSQQMGISSFIVREDQQSFYSLHFDFLNYTVAAALGPEIFLRRLRNKHNYCPSGALSLSLTLYLQPNFDVEASGTACNSTD